MSNLWPALVYNIFIALETVTIEARFGEWRDIGPLNENSNEANTTNRAPRGHTRQDERVRKTAASEVNSKLERVRRRSSSRITEEVVVMMNHRKESVEMRCSVMQDRAFDLDLSCLSYPAPSSASLLQLLFFFFPFSFSAASLFKYD